MALNWAGYLEKEFASYLSGERVQDKKMEESLAALSADQVKALVQYYASQQ